MNIPELRRRLREPGTELAQVPPEWQGLSWDQYMEVWWADMAELAQAARGKGPAQIEGKRIATSRDNYGWKSLPSGTPFFGGMGKK